MDSNKYGLIGELQAKPGNGQKLSEILLKAAKLMEQADGCYMYMVALDETDHDCVRVIEVWESPEAHKNSLGVPGVKELISEAMPLFAGPPQAGQNLKVLGGHFDLLW